MSQDYNFNVFEFPGAVTMPLKPNELITNTMFIPLARSMGASGILTNSIEFGAFTTAWDVSGLLSIRHDECRLIFFIIYRNMSSPSTLSRLAKAS